MKKKWQGEAESCDICGESLDGLSDKQWFVDGKTKHGPWAVMCPMCFETYGVGLGIGKGQKYDVKTLEKMEK